MSRLFLILAATLLVGLPTGCHYHGGPYHRPSYRLHFYWGPPSHHWHHWRRMNQDYNLMAPGTLLSQDYLNEPYMCVDPRYSELESMELTPLFTEAPAAEL